MPKIPTVDDVIREFEAMGGVFEQKQALYHRMVNRNYDATATAEVITSAIVSGRLVENPDGLGSISKPKA